MCFRYGIHQSSKSGMKAWYRCTSYSANKCRATAVLPKATNTLMKVTRPHQWWAKLLRLLTVNSLSYFVKIKY